MKVAQRLDQHDKQIRDLMKEGIKMVVETRRVALETRKDLRELATAQKRTDASLHALIASMRGGGNGHTKRRVN
jgi:Spy/CpxP family protein refolding chaperone